MDKTENTKAPFEVYIQNICLEKHTYTLPGAMLQERMMIERIYLDVWGKDYDKMYDWLTDPKKVTLTVRDGNSLFPR